MTDDKVVVSGTAVGLVVVDVDSFVGTCRGDTETMIGAEVEACCVAVSVQLYLHHNC